MRRGLLLLPLYALAFAGLVGALFLTSEPETILNTRPTLLAPFIAAAVAPTLLVAALWISAFIATRRRLESAVYAITDRRAIWMHGCGHRPVVHSLAPAAATTIVRIPRPYGTQDLLFNFSRRGGRDVTQTHTRGFVCIENAQTVERLFRTGMAT